MNKIPCVKLTSLAIKLLVCFVENSFLFSALRLPVRLYVSLLFVFFFVQFSKVSCFVNATFKSYHKVQITSTTIFKMFFDESICINSALSLYNSFILNTSLLSYIFNSFSSACIKSCIIICFSPASSRPVFVFSCV